MYVLLLPVGFCPLAYMKTHLTAIQSEHEYKYYNIYIKIEEMKYHAFSLEINFYNQKSDICLS